MSKDVPDIPDQGALVPLPTDGSALKALVRRGPTALAPATSAALAHVGGLAVARSASALERLQSGSLAVEIACDYSASTTSLHKTLTALATGLTASIRQSHPLARVSFGIFGGEGAIKTKQGAKVLDAAHVGTAGWESSFGAFADKYSATPDPARQDVLVSFHDANPAVTPELHAAIDRINQTNAVVIIAYVPSACSDTADRTVLQNLASPQDGFKNGIFIDLSGVDYKNSATMQGLLKDLVDGVAESNRDAARESGDNAEIRLRIARTRLATLVGGAVARAVAAPRAKPELK